MLEPFDTSIIKGSLNCQVSPLAHAIQLVSKHQATPRRKHLQSCQTYARAHAMKLSMLIRSCSRRRRQRRLEAKGLACVYANGSPQGHETKNVEPVLLTCCSSSSLCPMPVRSVSLKVSGHGLANKTPRLQPRRQE